MLKQTPRFSVLALSAAILLAPFTAASAFAAPHCHHHHGTNDDPVVGGGDPIPTLGMMGGGTIADIIVLAVSLASLA